MCGHDMPGQHDMPCQHLQICTASTTLERYNLKEITAHYRQLVVNSRVVNNITSFSFFVRASVQFVTVPVIL
jgi:hypothetical protein